MSKWERDEAFPEVEKLLKLAIKLGISLDELFEGELKGCRNPIQTSNGKSMIQ